MASDLNNLSVALYPKDKQAQDSAFEGLVNSNPDLANQTADQIGYSLSSDVLVSQPDFSLPDPSPSTSAAGELAFLESSSDSWLKFLKSQAEQTGAAEAKSFQDYIQQQLNAPTKSELKSDAYGIKGGVDDIQKELDLIGSQLKAEQHKLRRQLEAIDEKGGGLKVGAYAEKENLERLSLKKQADLAVIQMSIQGRYDSAKEIADRAIDAQFDADQKRIDLYQQVYDRNKDLFTESEKRLFEERQAERQRDFETKKQEAKDISDLSIDALSNGAPKAVAAKMKEAKTVAEAMEIGGQWVGKIARDKAYNDMAMSALDRRIKLLALAKEGDKDAIKELGLDPNAPDVEDKIAVRDEVTRLDTEIARLNGMLENDTGLQTSSGIVRSPFVSSFGVTVPAGTGIGVAAGTAIPGLGNVAGGIAGFGTGLVAAGFEYAQQKDAKAKFLAGANYIAANMTGDKIKEMKDRGINFTPLSEEEVALIGRASGTLIGYAIKDGTQIIGFTSEDGAREAIQEIITVMQTAREREFRKMLSKEELAEIEE